MSMTPTTEEAKTKGQVDWDRLNDLFEQMPAGPWDASRDTEGHEIRQIDTDPTNKHHWPFRLCRSVPGQRSACDDAVFDFIAGVLNAWPQIVAERSGEAEIKRIEALAKRAAGGKWFVSSNGADGLARLDNGTDEMFPVRGEWHEIEFIEALVNTYRNGDLAAPRAVSAERTAGEPQGAWMQTFCLPHFRVLDPDPSQILVEDIAHHLSQNVRYGGAGIRFLSVAEHSVHMARAASPEHALWALLHDASETYLHDLVRPVKRSLAGYAHAEDRIMRAVCERFGLSPKMPAAVKRLDNRILIDETRQNMRPSDVVWSFGGETEPLGITLQYWTPEQAEREFLATFAAITGLPVTMPSTPAPSSPGVPDSVREAFLAADLHECWVNGDTADVMTSPFPGCGNFNQIVARCATGDLWRKRAVAIAEALNFVRTLRSAHPAGQSTGQGAEKRTIKVPSPFIVDTPAPDSTRTGQVEAEDAADLIQQVDAILRKPPEPVSHPSEAWCDDYADWHDAYVVARSKALAARPAAPEAQGAWGSKAADDVLAERRRQVEAEGWTPEHDDQHSERELGLAAACYASAVSPISLDPKWSLPGAVRLWPWDSGWWKPSYYRRNLVKAGALILAEIERLDRLPAPPASSGQESA